MAVKRAGERPQAKTAVVCAEEWAGDSAWMVVVVVVEAATFVRPLRHANNASLAGLGQADCRGNGQVACLLATGRIRSSVVQQQNVPGGSVQEQER
jgi:hypothetical protein